MTDQNTPASTLREAAKKLREMAKEGRDFDPIPWRSVINGDRCDVEDAIGGPVAEDLTDEAALWIATLSPSVAEPLVAWLEKEADSFDQHLSDWASHPPEIIRTPEDTAAIVEHHFGHAIEFARAILGEPHPPPAFTALFSDDPDLSKRAKGIVRGEEQ